MASYKNGIQTTFLFLGIVLLLAPLDLIGNNSYVDGAITGSISSFKTRHLSPNYQENVYPPLSPRHFREYDTIPERHWNSSDNGHKKKQYPRSSKRRLPQVAIRNRNLIRNINVKYTNVPRSRRTSQLDRPTLRPVGNFNARNDAEILRAALRTKLVNEDDVIKIMTTRTEDQRQEIARYYPNLKNDLSLKLSFGFRELMKALATPLHEFHAHQLQEAFRFSSKLDEDLVIELLCTLNNHHLKILRQAYNTLFRKDIKDELRKFPGNPLEPFLISYIDGKRDERNDIDLSLATYDAQELQTAGKLRIDDGATFRKILLFRSNPQLKLTFKEYKRITRKSIRDAIRNDFSGNVQKGLLNIVKTITNRPEYFAEILNAGIKTFSKRDATLIRIIVLRSEIDMGDIKSSYKTLYNIELPASIPTNTGSLKKALISMISG